MWITFLDLLHKPFFRKSHGNFQVTAWNPKVWDFTLLFVFSFLRKYRQVTYPLSPFLFFNENLLATPPSSLQWPMHCSKETSSAWKWYKKKTSTAWKIITGNHVTIPVRSTGTEWTACAAETQSHQEEHFTLRDILGCLENMSPGNCNSALSGFSTPTSVLLFQMHFKCGQMECINVDLGAKYGKVSKRTEIIIFKKL